MNNYVIAYTHPAYQDIVIQFITAPNKVQALYQILITPTTTTTFKDMSKYARKFGYNFTIHKLSTEVKIDE